MDFFYSTRDKSVGFAEQIVLFALVFTVFFLSGCSRSPVTPSPKPTSPIALPSIHYAIQVGAFSNMENAIRLKEKLRKQGLNAYHFLHHSGLYRVRFGNFSSRTAAVNRASALSSAGIIHNFYVVAPKKYSKAHLRDKILRTADNFIGVPYRWGGRVSGRGVRLQRLYHDGIPAERVGTSQIVSSPVECRHACEQRQAAKRKSGVFSHFR